ncbi:hypothetical protein D1007_40892 [Hordeum vulgare]|nr:hypothetical protein D1007_40892 [Hordeum vulgare]KAI4969942.1 hypothetical protein ZWY2020_000856 [Hordeum vulgare]
MSVNQPHQPQQKPGRVARVLVSALIAPRLRHRSPLKPTAPPSPRARISIHLAASQESRPLLTSALGFCGAGRGERGVGMEGSSSSAAASMGAVGRAARAGAKVCGKEEKVVGVQKAPGSCPYCGGGVVATDVEAKWVLCFLPLCLKNKRRFACTACARRLVTYPAIVQD